MRILVHRRSVIEDMAVPGVSKRTTKGTRTHTSRKALTEQKLPVVLTFCNQEGDDDEEDARAEERESQESHVEHAPSQ